jgi:hypothetical protein
VASGAVVLTASYLPKTVIADGGYAFAYSDGVSTACLDAAALCATGTTGVNPPTTVYGSGIGFNLNQAMATGTVSPPISPFTATGLGLSYKLSSLPAQGVRIAIDGPEIAGVATDYCAVLSTTSGTVAWAKFNSKCWDDSGVFLTGPPTNATHIEFQVPAVATATPFNFCVDSVAFATTVATPDAGSVASCNGSACCAPAAGPAANGNGEFTCYTFKQGTVNNKTFCGYQGSEAAGPGGSGACQAGMLDFSDTVPNIAGNSGYFAAFPSGSAFGQGTYCGMCVDVTYGGQTLMGTIVDECATCGDSAQHIDLSVNLARALGIGVGGVIGNPQGVTWKAVACPITSHIQAVWNNNNPAGGQVYFQNVVFPVKSVSGASQSDGIWSTITNGSTHTLTDMEGHTVTAAIVTGDIGVQFPATCP